MSLFKLIEKGVFAGLVAGLALTLAQWILATKLAEGPADYYILVVPM